MANERSIDLVATREVAIEVLYERDDEPAACRTAPSTALLVAAMV